jgi:hypothetical protein
MSSKRGLILFWVFVIALGILNVLLEKSFRSGAESREERLLRIDIDQFVTSLVGNVALGFIVVSVILYLRLRRVENEVSRLREELQRKTNRAA